MLLEKGSAPWSLIYKSYYMISRMPTQIKNSHWLAGTTNFDYISNLRVERNTFCEIVSIIARTRWRQRLEICVVKEQVALFLGVLAHHKKNRVVGFDFWKSGETISQYIHMILKALLLRLVKPELVSKECICWEPLKFDFVILFETHLDWFSLFLEFKVDSNDLIFVLSILDHSHS